MLTNYGVMDLKKTVKSICAVALCLNLIFAVFSWLEAVALSDGGDIYYVDSVYGSDKNDGLSSQRAWKSLEKVSSTVFSSGDKILFRAGCVFSGQLFPKGSGSADKPIIIDMYETGPKPVIAADGTCDSALTLYNQEYFEINNLEITSNNSKTVKYGVCFTAEDCGTLNHIYIRNCYIRDIAGNITSKLTGGIFYRVKGTAVKSNFNDVLIENNTLRTVDRTGITLDAYNSWSNKLLGENEAGVWYPSTNVTVRGNFVDDIGGDGIVVKCCDGAIIEYNTAKNCNARSNEACVAIWTWNSNNCIMQFNEAYGTHFSHDGQGFDVDSLCENTLVQYNYSHDNEGGFLLVCAPGEEAEKGYYTKDTTVRYNISQNDGRLSFMYSGNIHNTSVYNNTVYVGEGKSSKIIDSWDWGGAWAKGGVFANNLIYNLGDGEYNMGEIDIDVFNNLFYGNHPDTEPYDAAKITADPMLVNAGSGETGIYSADGYKLKYNSPALKSGAFIENCGERDYFGNPIDKTSINIGAYGGEGEYEVGGSKKSVIPSDELCYIHPIYVNTSADEQVLLPDYAAVRLKSGKDILVKAHWDNKSVTPEQNGSYSEHGLIYLSDGSVADIYATVIADAREPDEILGKQWQCYNGREADRPDLEAGDYIRLTSGFGDDGVLRIGRKDCETNISLKLTNAVSHELWGKYEATVYLDGSINENSYILIKNADAWGVGEQSRTEISGITPNEWIDINNENVSNGTQGLSGSAYRLIDGGYVTVDFVISLPAGSYLYIGKTDLAVGSKAYRNNNIDTQNGDEIIYSNDFYVESKPCFVNTEKIAEWSNWVAESSQGRFEDCVALLNDKGNTRLYIHNEFSDFTGSIVQNVLGIENGNYTLSVDYFTPHYSSAVIAAENYGGAKMQTAVSKAVSGMKTVTMYIPVTNGRVDVTLYASGNCGEYLILDNVTLKKDGTGDNLIQNGDFEDVYGITLLPKSKSENAVKWGKWENDVSPENIFRADTGHKSNSSMAVVFRQDTSCNFNQTVSGLTPEKTYVVSAYVKSSSDGMARLFCKNWGGTLSVAIPKTDIWVKIFTEITVAENRNTISLEFYGNSSGENWFAVDDVMLYDKTNPSVNLLLNGGFECVIGDADYNGKIEASDLAAIRKICLKNTAFYDLSADTNDDGTVDIRDIVRLKKYIAGLQPAKAVLKMTSKTKY